MRAIRRIILGNGAASGTKGAVYLGRPWGDYAQVIFQNTDEGNMITAAGWERAFLTFISPWNLLSSFSILMRISMDFHSSHNQHPLWRIRRYG